MVDPVLCVAWSPDGGNIVSGSDDGSLKVFNFQMSELHHSFDELYVGKRSSFPFQFFITKTSLQGA